MLVVHKMDRRRGLRFCLAPTHFFGFFVPCSFSSHHSLSCSLHSHILDWLPIFTQSIFGGVDTFTTTFQDIPSLQPSYLPYCDHSGLSLLFTGTILGIIPQVRYATLFSLLGGSKHGSGVVAWCQTSHISRCLTLLRWIKPTSWSVIAVAPSLTALNTDIVPETIDKSSHCS